MFNNGRQFSEEYVSHINPNELNDQNVRVYSSSRQRCSESARAFLQGLTYQDDLTSTKSDISMQNFTIEEEDHDTNYLFSSNTLCKGIRQLTVNKKFSLPPLVKTLVFDFFKKMNDKYSFQIESLVPRISSIFYFKLHTIYEYLEFVKYEHDLEILDAQDYIQLKVMVTYIFLKLNTDDNSE